MTLSAAMDAATTILEVLALVLLIVGAGVVTAVAVGGGLGAGVGLLAAGAVSGVASVVLQLVHRGEAAS